jgi:hypothetical protein
VIALHNDGVIIQSGKDLKLHMEQSGLTSLHPKADAVFKPVEISFGKAKAKSFKFEGFQDHHLFNAYYDNSIKRGRWGQIFDDSWTSLYGGKFDVDSFTVPLETVTHSKVSDAITRKWDDFLNPYFDAAGALKPGVDKLDLRSKTLIKMDDICTEFKIDRTLIRPHPKVLNRGQADTLYQRFVQSGGKLRSSNDELAEMAKTAAMFASPADKVKLAQLTGQTLQKTSLHLGKGAAVRLLPIVSVICVSLATENFAVNEHEQGWEEAMAIQINDFFGWEDIDLAREVVNYRFAHNHIPGGADLLLATINPTQKIKLGDHAWETIIANEQVAHVIAWTVVEIKLFPGPVLKIAYARDDFPSDVRISENPKYTIDDYYPQPGDSYSFVLAAQRRASLKQ